MQYIYLLLLIFSLQQCSEFVDDGSNDVTENVPENVTENDTIKDNGDNSTDTIHKPKEPILGVDTFPHIEIARANIGVPSTDSINAWLAFVGLPPSNPWCAASQSAWLHQAGIKEPLLKTGLARNYVYQTPTRLQVSAGRVLAGVVTMPKGSLAIYQRGDTRFGHIGAITEDWSGQNGRYISGNTSPPSSAGSEFSGGGVWEKDARIIPTSPFGIREFVYIRY